MMKQSQKMMFGFAGLIACVIIAFAALARVSLEQSEPNAETSNTGVTDMQSLRGFTGITSKGKWKIQLIQGPEWQVKLDYPDDLKENIRAYVRNEQLILEINSRRWWGGNNSQPKAKITMPELNRLNISGAGEVQVSGFKGKQLELNLAGAIDLKGLDGRYERIEISGAGATDIDLQGVVAKSVELDIAGASSIILTMDGGELTGTMAGAGSIEYYGNVSKQSVDIMGAGSVEQVE